MQTRKTGVAMFFVAWFVLLAMLVWYFGGREQDRINPNQNITADGETVVLEKNSFDQYIFTGKINNQPVTFLVDTGATSVTISEELARKLRLERKGAVTITTASGYARGWQTTLHSLDIGGIRLSHIEAIINPAMPTDFALLGMNALQYIDFNQQGDSLILRYSQ